MPGQEPILKDQDRSKLDGIVEKMKANKESDVNIQAVVNDFKSKYAKSPSPESSTEPVKKKEETSGLAVSPSGSLETKPKTEPSSTPSVSDGQYKETIFDTILGKEEKEKPKNKKQDFVNSPGAEDMSDETGSLLNTTEQTLTKGAKEADKAKVHERIINLRNNFFTGSLTPEDIDLIPGDLNGVSSKQASEAVNNKTKNLRIWGNIAVMKGIQNATDQLSDIDKKIDLIKGTQKASRMFGKLAAHDPNADAEIKDLENKKAFLNKSITSVYNAEVDKASKDLIQVLKPSLGTKKTILGDVEGPIKYDPYTNTLDEKSEFYIRKQVDDYLNVHHNDVINYKTSGNTSSGKRNYPDVANRVISYFNTVIPVQKAHQQVLKDIETKYPAAKGLLDHIDQINTHFDKDQVEKADAYIKTFQDKSFLGLQDRYFGTGGVMSSNPEFQTIQKKYQDAVKNKEMPQDVALKQMQAEVQENKNLKKIYGNYSKSVEGVQTQAKKMWQDYMINGLKKIDPSLTMYANGNVGIEGLNQTESKKIFDEYSDNIAKSTAKTLHDQSEKAGHRASEKAAHVGAFWSSFGGAINDMQGAFAKYLFDKTGWGGEAVEMYQAAHDANIPLTESDEARKWNWTGLKSLKDPNFYLSSLGAQLPLFGGAAAVTAATRGAGLPEYVGWASAAGIFDASQSIQNYNEISVNGKDKFGNKLTEHDAAKAAADQFSSTMLPDLLFASANLGILSRAKNISKPTLLKSIATSAKGLAIGTVPMVWQGYGQYASQLEAEGKTPDFWDYAQDGKLANSLIEGVVGGAFLQMFHAPGEHIRQTENWKRMIHTGPSEFTSNSMFNALLGQEIAGRGNQFRDAMKLKIATEEMTPAEKEDVKNDLFYSTALEKNIKGGGIDVTNVNGAYHAHSLALADLHDYWSKVNEDNPNLSKIYSEQAGDFRKEAKAAMEGKGKFKFLEDNTGKPIFISDQSFKVLDADGTVADWIKTGTIEGIHSSDDPNFDRAYKEKMKSTTPEPEHVPVKEADIETDDQQKIINALKTHAGDLTGTMKLTIDGAIEDPKKYEDLTKEIISQAIDHPVLTREMLGKNVWDEIEPIVKKQRKENEATQRARDFEDARDEANTKVLDQKIEGIDLSRKARKEVSFEGKKMRMDAAIDKLKDRHTALKDILNNCL